MLRASNIAAFAIGMEILSIGTAAYAQEIGDIVVTAQRRQERLQDVPIAVSVVTSDQMTKAGINNTDALGSAVPGLVVSRGQNTGAIYLRGVGTQNAAVGDENSVALYIDGVYVFSPSASIFNFSNIERIEVLRGPQGTLFGRNAVGGLIQVVTRDPKQDPSADLSVGYGNYKTVTASAYLTGGITQNIAADISGFYMKQRKGFGTNIFNGQDVNKSEEGAVRSKWLIDPTESLQIRVAGGYSKLISDIGITRAVFPGSFLPGGQTTLPNIHDTNSNRQPYRSTEQYDASLNIRQELGIADLVSITAYRHDHTIFLSDSDSRPVTVSHPSSYQTTKSFSQELQLVSSADSKINWIVGLFYLNAPSSYDLFRSQTATTMTALTSSQSLHSYSAFGQGSVDIIDNTKLTAGIRYTKDKRAFSLRSLNPTTLATVAGPFNQKASFGAPTWRVSLDHNFTHDILGYVSYNRGFKGGVFNQLSPTNPPVRPTKIDAYEVGLKSDLLDRRLRLNVDGYYYKVRDLQLQAIIQVSPPVTSLINAASGTAYGFEAELEARPVENLTLTGNLSLNHSRITFPNAPFNRPNAGPLPGGNTAVVKDATGNQLGRLAKVAFNLGGQYLVPVGENSLTFAANWSHTGAFFWETVNRLRQPKYDLVNGSITFATKGDRWSLRVWSKNLFNQKYFSYAISSAATGDTAVAGDPRTFGATVGVKF